VAQEALFSRLKQSAAIKKESQSRQLSSARYLLASAARFAPLCLDFLNLKVDANKGKGRDLGVGEKGLGHSPRTNPPGVQVS
jgi:hypothetical protein